MSRSAWLKVFVVSALVVMMAGLQAQAQSTGTLEGIVTNNAGAVVPGASVMVRNIATGEQRTTQTGGSCNPSTVAFTVDAIPGTTFPVRTCTPNAGFGTIRNASTGAVITPTTFGRIQAARSPTGDAGSARQIQFALKLKF